MLNKKTGTYFSTADENAAARFATLLAFTLQGGGEAQDDAAQEDPDPNALVAQAESGALALLDLSANRRFAVLDAPARSRLIDRITSATASGTLRTVLLNDLQLDNSNAPAVASLLRSSTSTKLRAVALERNLLSEEGLLLLSAALRGSALTEVSLANQRAAEAPQ